MYQTKLQALNQLLIRIIKVVACVPLGIKTQVKM